jgi:antitoxin VapB
MAQSAKLEASEAGNAPRTLKARVFMSGRSQHVTIPAEYRFDKEEVSIRRDPDTGDIILSQKPTWDEVFAALDAAPPPEDLLEPRDQGFLAEREPLV